MVFFRYIAVNELKKLSRITNYSSLPDDVDEQLSPTFDKGRSPVTDTNYDYNEDY